MLRAESVTFTYGDAQVLAGIDLEFGEAETVALVGPSGCGKTTLLYCLSGLLAPSGGSVAFRGTDLAGLDEEGRARLRRTSFGFVFQNSELVPELTLRENIALPLELTGTPRAERGPRVDALLARLDLVPHAGRRAAQLSGGQRQRAAVARAVVHAPAVVFADEPTGALDSANGTVVMDLLIELARAAGSTIVLVTHDAAVAGRADRIVRLLDGRLDPRNGGRHDDDSADVPAALRDAEVSAR